LLELNTPLIELYLHDIPRIGPTIAKKLAVQVAVLSGKSDVREATVEDLLHYMPMRYEDRSRLVQIKDLEDGMFASIEVEVRVAGSYAFTSKKGGNYKIFEFSATDPTGQIRAFWWGQTFLEKVFQRGQRYFLFGQWKRGRRGFFEVENPEYEPVADPDDGESAAIHTGRRVPVYRKLGDFRTRQLRTIIHHILERVSFQQAVELLPQEIIERNQLIPRARALRLIHFPESDAPLEQYERAISPAHRRLIFEEFFWLTLALGVRRQNREAESKGTTIEINDFVREMVRSILPFKPTSAQKRVLKQIVDDMASPRPMNRLLQGDVGSGKTIVAVQAMVVAMVNGYQTALMAPTEILAEQHARNVRRILARTPFRVELLTGSTPSSEKRELREAIKEGDVDLVIGTHALIQEGVEFHKLGLVVIDEQHRFGVLQRAELIRRGYHPDVLVMTATPIPRSLAMTVYGDLDVSIIDEMPPGRTPVKTQVRGDEARQCIYRFIAGQVRSGRQVYIVYPLVEESEKLDLLNATQMAEHLQRSVFPNFRIGLIHGRMKQAEKDDTMSRFVSGEIQILVATTVIEVGIDVPNATVMLIEHAERFGLSQLHQLRGRVGRGAAESHCILLASHKKTAVARERLGIMEQTSDGFRIAEKDLEIRGPGEVMGTRQHGIPAFRIGNIVRDQPLLEAAKREVDYLLTHRRNTRETARLVAHVRKQPKFGLAMVG